ncbi:MAG: hypothetical protein WC299_06290 [Kiritimatiellia bacterium]
MPDPHTGFLIENMRQAARRIAKLFAQGLNIYLRAEILFNMFYGLDKLRIWGGRLRHTPAVSGHDNDHAPDRAKHFFVPVRPFMFHFVTDNLQKLLDAGNIGRRNQHNMRQVAIYRARQVIAYDGLRETQAIFVHVTTAFRNTALVVVRPADQDAIRAEIITTIIYEVSSPALHDKLKNHVGIMVKRMRAVLAAYPE